MESEKQRLGDAARKIARAELATEIDEHKEALNIAEAELNAKTQGLVKAKEREMALREAQKNLQKEKDDAEATVESRLRQEMDEKQASLKNTFESEMAIRTREKDSEIEQVRKSIEDIRSTEEKRAQAGAKQELETHRSRLSEVENLLSSANEKVAMSNEAEADFLKKKRQFESDKRHLELSVQQKVDAELGNVRLALTDEIETDFKLRLREKDTQLQGMKTEIESLKRKADQGSQQLQGEVYEQEVSEILQGKFPNDKINRVPKGKNGGDCLHDVYNEQGKLCGTILWELKRTSKWDEKWLVKLKNDQHAAKADVAIIVSQHLPKDVKMYERRGETWVAGLDCLVPVAGSLRHLLIEIAMTRRATEGHQDKASLIYSYVTSVAFRQRVEAMTQTYKTMQADLQGEQSAIKKIWAKRQTQLDRMIEATSGMYGDLQGIAGQNVPELDGIGFAALEAES